MKGISLENRFEAEDIHQRYAREFKLAITEGLESYNQAITDLCGMIFLSTINTLM